MKIALLRLLVLPSLVLLSTCRPAPHDARPFDYVIGVSMANLTEPWRISMRDEINAEAARYRDLRIVFTDAADSNSRQIQDVHTLLDSGIDLLIISPNESEALSPVIAEAYHRVPVILLDRSVIGFDYTLFIGPDNRLIGKQAGQYVTELLGGKGGKIVEILGRSGSPPVLDRSIGFRDAISNRRDISIVGTIVADWLRDKAEDELTSWLGKYGRVDVIFAQNDAMADGARRAAAKLGIGGIRVVGIDGLPGPNGGIEMVRRGDLSATFTCPTGGKEAVIYALDILHHEEGIPKKMILRTSLVTEKNVDSTGLDAPVRPRLPPDRHIVLGFAQTGRKATGASRTRNPSRPRPARPASTSFSSTRREIRRSRSPRCDPSSRARSTSSRFPRSSSPGGNRCSAKQRRRASPCSCPTAPST